MKIGNTPHSMPQRQCPACDEPIPSGVEGALCPRCLLGLAGNEGGEVDDGTRRFADYELEGEIARGGMGVIYRARQLGLDRPVAIKMVAGEGLRSASGRMRFQIEAEAIASLDHPNIVSLFESGEQDGQLFYSMQLVTGGTLADDLKAGQTDQAEQLRRFLKVVRAVQYAHSKGILHRDLKPSNILLDDRGEPFLADFGLAKLEEGDLDLTRSETVMGSPNYMAPEQARGAGVEAVSTSTDIYSLGAILYEILCGVPPFVADTPLETMRRVVDEELGFPSTAKRIDADLRVISQKCLEKNPRSRYRSAAALVDDLERWERGEALEARPVGRLERFGRWIRREPALASALGGVALMLMSVAAISSTSYVRIQGANAELQEANAETAQQLYLSQLREVDDLFAKEQSSEAMALIGKLGRDWPNDERLRRRMRNILNYQAIPILVSPFVHLTRGKVLDWALAGKSHVQVVLSNGEILQIDQARGAVLDSLYRAKSDVRKASVGRLSLDVAMLLKDNSLLVVGLSSARGEQAIPAEGEVTHLALSPDGSRVAIVEDWSKLKIRDVRNGQMLGGSIRLPRNASVVEFSDDGQLFAVGMSRGGCLIGDSATGGVLEHLDETVQTYHDISFGRRNRMVAFASPGGAVALWDRHAGSRIEDGEFNVNWRVNGVQLSSDGEWSLAMDSGGSARLIHLPNGRVEHVFRHIDYVSCGVFDPDGTTVLTGSHDRTVRVWDVESGRSLSYPLSHTSGIQDLAFGVDSGDVRALGYDGTVWRWQVGSSLLDPSISSPGRFSQSAVYHRDQEWVVVGLETDEGDRIIRLVDVATGREMSRFATRGIAGELSVDALGERVAFRVDSQVEVRNLRSGESVSPPIEFPFGGIEGLDLGPKGGQVAIASRWEALRIVSLGNEDRSEQQLDGVGADWVQFSPDGLHVVTSKEGVGCELWNLAKKERVALLAPNGKAHSFSPDGRYVSILNGEKGYLIDMETLHWIPGEVQHDSHIQTIAFGSQSRWVATASRDETVQVFRIEDNRLKLVTQLWHHAAVNAVAFSSEADWLVTGTEDGQVRLWDSVSGFPLSEWLRHDDAILEVAIGADDTWFSAVSRRGTVSTWPIASPEPHRESWLPDMLEYLARHRVDRIGRAVSLSLQEMASRRQRLLNELARDPESPVLNRFLSAESADKDPSL